MGRRHKKAVPSITTAASAESRAIDHRERNYLVSMAVRSLCFVAFVVIDHPIRWVFLLGAVFLPYIAVVIGNAAAIRRAGDGPSPFGIDRPELGPGEKPRL